jgi:hypothetical protein
VLRIRVIFIGTALYIVWPAEAFPRHRNNKWSQMKIIQAKRWKDIK